MAPGCLKDCLVAFFAWVSGFDDVFFDVTVPDCAEQSGVADSIALATG